MKRVLIAAGVAGVALALTACGSSDTATTPVATPTASASASPSEDLVGGSPATWSPMELTSDVNGGTVKLVPEEAAVFPDLPAIDGLNQIEVQSSDPSVVAVIQPQKTDSYESGAGIFAKKAGTATITIINPAAPADQGGASNVLMQFTVIVEPYVGDDAVASDGAGTVTDSTIVGGDPATWAPVMIDKGMKSLSLVTKQHAVFPDYEYASGKNYVAVSSDDKVVRVESADDSMVPSFIAVGKGTATVTVRDGFVDKSGVTVVQKVTVTVE